MKKHIPHFDVLRGSAALWVFASHVFLIIGQQFRPLSNGSMPVELFILLSGFVIGLLLSKRQEPYAEYLFRRAARIYPLFLLALAAGVLTAHLYPQVFGASPWLPAQKPELLARTLNEQAYFWQHLLAHLTMLHGVLPDYVLPHSALAFAGPLWSISLEWQFYLVAPFLMLLLRGSLLRIACTGLALLVMAYMLEKLGKQMWDADVPAFLPLRLDLFCVGMLCAALWDRARNVHPLLLAVMVAVAAVLTRKIAPQSLPVWIWFSVYYLACVSGRCWLGRVSDIVFNLQPARRIGEISYGIYVLHTPVLLLVTTYIAIPLIDASSPWLAGLIITAIALPITIFVANLSYQYVELPMMGWGRRVTQKMEARRLTQTPATA